MMREPLLCALPLLIRTMRLPAQNALPPAEPPQQAAMTLPFARIADLPESIPLEVKINGKGPHRVLLDSGA